MKLKFSFKREMKITLVICLVFGLIAFTERMKGEISVGNIRISIDNIHGNHFVDENDIVDLMQWDHENLKGVSISKINFTEIENRIKKDPFIRDADIYTDLKGNILVNVELRRPVARIVRNDGYDAYIAEDGTVMPVSEKFTSRVLLISGGFIPALLGNPNVFMLEQGGMLMNMLHTINEDEFWRAQIAQLHIDSKARITILPQVGDERIEFGKPDDIEMKFRKLKMYYREILPRAGWNKYNRVNLEYEGQIIAE